MKRFFEKDFISILGEAAAKELYEVLDKHEIQDNVLWWGVVEHNDNDNMREDVKSHLQDTFDEVPDLSDNEELVDFIAHIAEARWDSELGTWDNINSAIDWIMSCVEPTTDKEKEIKKLLEDSKFKQEFHEDMEYLKSVVFKNEEDK